MCTYDVRNVGQKFYYLQMNLYTGHVTCVNMVNGCI